MIHTFGICSISTAAMILSIFFLSLILRMGAREQNQCKQHGNLQRFTTVFQKMKKKKTKQHTNRFIYQSRLKEIH